MCNHMFSNKDKKLPTVCIGTYQPCIILCKCVIHEIISGVTTILIISYILIQTFCKQNVWINIYEIIINIKITIYSLISR